MLPASSFHPSHNPRSKLMQKPSKQASSHLATIPQYQKCIHERNPPPICFSPNKLLKSLRSTLPLLLWPQTLTLTLNLTLSLTVSLRRRRRRRRRIMIQQMSLRLLRHRMITRIRTRIHRLMIPQPPPLRQHLLHLFISLVSLAIESPIIPCPARLDRVVGLIAHLVEGGVVGAAVAEEGCWCRIRSDHEP